MAGRKRKGSGKKGAKASSSKKAPAKKEPAKKEPAKKGSKKGSTPSVMQFLEKIGGAPETPRKRSTPARGLLGDISREDLVRAGRIERDSSDGPLADSSPPRPAPELQEGPSAGLEVELQAEERGGAEGRKARRLRFSEQVKISSVFADEQLGKTGNLSSGGVFVETAHLLDEGDPVMLNFPGKDGSTLHVTGRVRWVTPFGGLDDAVAGMGIEFVGLDPRRRARLEALLANLPHEPDREGSGG